MHQIQFRLGLCPDSVLAENFWGGWKVSTVERQKIKQYNSVSARSPLPSHRMKTLRGDSITRIGGKTGGGGRWEKTGAPPPSAPSLEPRLVALTKLPEKTLCRYNSFELIYSSLFTKYGRQLNRKKTELIQRQRRYKGSYISNAKVETNVRQLNFNN